MRQRILQGRRAILTGLAALAGLGAAGVSSARADIGETGGFDGTGGPELVGREIPFRVRTADSGRFAPARVVVLTLEGALAGPAPDFVTVIDRDRLDVSSVPLFGRLFGGQPATAAIIPANELGPLWRAGDALVIDLSNAPVIARDLLRRPPAAISSWLGAPMVVVEAPLTLASAGASELPANALRIGSVYLQGDRVNGRLVLSPPPETLFGW